MGLQVEYAQDEGWGSCDNRSQGDRGQASHVPDTSLSQQQSNRRRSVFFGGEDNMVAEITMGLGALKSAFDIAKGLKDIDNAARINAAVIELQEKILSAQSAQTDLVEIVGALKSRVVELEAWDTDKQRYELKEIQTGVTAYALKEGMEGTEPTHYLCPNCYTNNKKKILQREVRAPGMVQMLICHHCGLELICQGQRHPQHGKAPRGRT
jgi:hypothetical protein